MWATSSTVSSRWLQGGPAAAIAAVLAACAPAGGGPAVGGGGCPPSSYGCRTSAHSGSGGAGTSGASSGGGSTGTTGAGGTSGSGVTGGTTGSSGTNGGSSGGSSSSGASGASGTSGTTGGTTGASGSSGGSTGGSSGSGSSCPAPLAAAVYDFTNNAPLSGVTVSLLDGNEAPIAQVLTDADGGFSFCPPLGTRVSGMATAVGYETSYSSELVLAGPDVFFSNAGNQFPIITTAEYAGIAGYLGPSGATPGDALVIVSVAPLQGCSDPSGFSVRAQLSDGGQLPDGGALPFQVAYLRGGFPNAAAAVTDDGGMAIVYDVDPSIANAIVVTASRDGGGCNTVDFSLLQQTGRVFIGPDALSLAVVPVR